MILIGSEPQHYSALVEPTVNQHILFVIENLFSLGAAQQLRVLAEGLVKQGYKIHVAVLGQRSFEPTQWTDLDIEVSFLNGDDKTPLHTMRDGFQVVKELRQLIAKLSPTIVHTWCGNAELLTLIAAVENIPMTKPLKQFRLISTELYRQPEKRFVQQLAENRMSQRVEQMIVPHDSVKQHLMENGYRESKISIVPNAVAVTTGLERIEAKRELCRRLGLPESSKLAGTVARLHHRSRLKDLIWATDLLTCIGENFHFVVIGTGTQLKQLKRFASLTESRHHVHFLGQPDQPESLIAGLDFYWHSHLNDPLSGNLLSAMAHQIPAISVLGPGTEPIIQHQTTGMAVNFGARDEFARWTKYFIEKSESAQQLAIQGKNHVASNFDKSKMIDGYIQIYNSAE